MLIKAIVKKGAYHDSVSLMKAARELNSLKGVLDSAVVMATKENKAIVRASGLYNAGLDNAGDNDLVISVKACDGDCAARALKKAEELLISASGAKGGAAAGGAKASGIADAVRLLGGADLAVVSVAGRFAGKVAMDCLESGLHVMLFSDNVSLETEIGLKRAALKKDLLMMGPDCGTAIINGAPLGFANSVRRGGIGIVAASGTGLQEVSTLISNEGGGVSQAIGAGSRDVKLEVGAMTFMQGLKALNKDRATSLIVLISKPPHPFVLKKILAEVKRVKKPVVAIFLGGDVKLPSKKNFYLAETLEEAAMKAVYIAKDESLRARERLFDINTAAASAAAAEGKRKKPGQKYLKGLFSGGTFASEAQIVLNGITGPLRSNVPLDKKHKLPDPLKLKGNCVIDMGEDEFTVGRPHPMIDYSLRNRLMISEAGHADTAVILLDVVLGYGSNERPLDDILPAVAAAFKNNRTLSIVASVTGTETDPQVRSAVVAGLKKAGVIVMPSNASACRVAGEIVRRLGKRKS